MIPLSVVNQGKSVIQINVSLNASTYHGAIYLDEEFKKVMNRWPSNNENVNFTINSKSTIIPTVDINHGLNSGSHWNSTNVITVLNYGTIYGRGGDGGLGAIVLRYGNSNNNVYRIPAKPGDDGYAPISNTTSTKLTVRNYGKLIAGGGGGGGGAAWEYDMPDTFAGYNWWMRVNGSAAGGGAPNGKHSPAVGTPQWYILIASSPSNYNSNITNYETKSLAQNQPRLGLIVHNYGNLKTLSRPERNMVGGKGFNSAGYGTVGDAINLTLNKLFPALSDLDLADMVPVTTFSSYTYTVLKQKDYAYAPLAKRYASKNLLSYQLATLISPFGIEGSLSPVSLMPSDSKILEPGYGGSTCGVLNALPQLYNHRGWSGIYWYGRPSADLMPPYAWDDNFGGDGGRAGANGHAGYYVCAYADTILKASAGNHRARKITKEYIDANKSKMDYEPPALGGKAGPPSVGNVSIVNESGGSIISR